MTARQVAGVLAAAGILSAAATTVWPTKIVVLRPPEGGGQGYEHRMWSWGREAVYSSGGVLYDGYSGPVPTLALVFLVVALVLGAAGVVAWFVLPGQRGEVLGTVGVAVAAAVVGQSVVARLAFDDRSLGLEPGLVVVTTTAGWLQYAAACLLVVALALMLVTQLWPALLPRLAGAAARFARNAERARQDDDVPRQPAPLIRDVPAKPASARGEQTAEGGLSRSGSAEPVGFTDRPVE